MSQADLAASIPFRRRLRRKDVSFKTTVRGANADGKDNDSGNTDFALNDDQLELKHAEVVLEEDHYGLEKVKERILEYLAVRKLRKDPKSPILVADDFDRPNGLCFSLDGRRLFVNDTARQHIRVFDVEPDGGLSGGKVWAETVGEGTGAPDGMKIDSAGNVYCCGPGGIHVFTPDAVCLGVIHVPERTANFAWGDTDYRSLYITASTSVYKIRVQVPGLPAL